VALHLSNFPESIIVFAVLIKLSVRFVASGQNAIDIYRTKGCLTSMSSVRCRFKVRRSCANVNCRGDCSSCQLVNNGTIRN
jgi:hypothetical protein